MCSNAFPTGSYTPWNLFNGKTSYHMTSQMENFNCAMNKSDVQSDLVNATDDPDTQGRLKRSHYVTLKRVTGFTWDRTGEEH